MAAASAVGTRVGGLLVALVACAASLLAAAGAHASESVTQRFTATGAEQTFAVPAGVTTIAVRAVGGTGKGGGAPAEVTGNVAVSPGETLYVEVGGSATGQGGGFNGGGEGGNAAAGGGGGASDVRTVTRADPEATLASRLIVAGASGGGSSTGNGGGAAGAEGLPLEQGGKPGTQTAGGESEELWECWIEKEHEGKHEGGTPGQLGAGGEGEGCRSKSHGGDGGGGGGAGLYGGGGGGVEFDVEPPYEFASGGGGGSSLVPEGGTSALAEGAAPEIELTYAHLEAPPQILKVGPAKKGLARGGTKVRITGSWLANVSEVLFGATAAPSFTVDESGSVIQAVAPANTVGKVAVRVISPGGESAVTSKDVFRYVGLAVSEVSPSSGPRAGGTSVTVTGAGFAPGSGSTAFVFGKAAATGVECSSTTECTMTAPAGAKAGSVDVRASVTGVGGKSKKSGGDRFTYQ